jgi:hypothetical protein
MKSLWWYTCSQQPAKSGYLEPQMLILSHLSPNLIDQPYFPETLLHVILPAPRVTFLDSPSGFLLYKENCVYISHLPHARNTSCITLSFIWLAKHYSLFSLLIFSRAPHVPRLNKIKENDTVTLFTRYRTFIKLDIVSKTNFCTARRFSLFFVLEFTRRLVKLFLILKLRCPNYQILWYPHILIYCDKFTYLLTFSA